MKNKLLATLGLTGVGGGAFAEGSSSSGFTQATTALTQVESEFSTFISSASPTIVNILIAGLGLWAVYMVIKLAKKAFSRAA